MLFEKCMMHSCNFVTNFIVKNVSAGPFSCLQNLKLEPRAPYRKVPQYMHAMYSQLLVHTL